ncbi:MAG: LuxR C-terminal-related transcriptional regulator [Coriobacteriales bacterium]|nr:LuxR C-terminal-related transcriptional regulator [Coriobacteriales bacterium]
MARENKHKPLLNPLLNRTRFSNFGYVNLLTVVASACYWAWFDQAIFRPTLLLPFANAQSFFSSYFAVAMISGSLALLLATVYNSKLANYIKLQPYGVLAVILAVLGNVLTMAGANIFSPLFIHVGAAITGITCSFFLLEWARIYSKQGAQNASLLISAAIALGVLLDIFIIGLSPLFAAIFTTALTLTVLLILVIVCHIISPENSASDNDAQGNNEQSLKKQIVQKKHQGASDESALAYYSAQYQAKSQLQSLCQKPNQNPSQNQVHNPDQNQVQNLNQNLAISSDAFFTSNSRLFFGLSLSLCAAFFVFGLSFGFMQFNSAFYQTELYPLTSDALLISRGITALIIFLALWFFPRHLYNCYRIGILIGIAGFIMVPFLSTAVNNSLITGFVIAIGYTTFDIVTWTLLAQIAFSGHSSSVKIFGAGRFIVHVAVVVGFLLAWACLSNPETFPYKEAISATIGYLLVVGAMLLLGENSALWTLIGYCQTKTERKDAENWAEGTPAYDYPDDLIYKGQAGAEGDAEQPDTTHSNILSCAIAFGLTQREIEVLRYLVLGRSTPRIAQVLIISENTVHSHIRHIYRKFGVHNRQELLDYFS